LHDNSDVSLNAVFQDSLGITVNAHPTLATATVVVTQVKEGDGLVVNDDSEDIWASTDKGHCWDELAED
jgi:hypothetical protein